MKQTLYIDGKPVTLENLARKAQEVSFSIGKKNYNFRASRQPDGSYVLEQEMGNGVWQRMSGGAWQVKDGKRVQLNAWEAKITEPSSETGSAGQGALSPTAPMPGLVRQIFVKKGDKIKSGQPLAVMEAMKLQMTLAAGADATVDAVLVREGDMIAEGVELVRLIPAKKAA